MIKDGDHRDAIGTRLLWTPGGTDAFRPQPNDFARLPARSWHTAFVLMLCLRALITGPLWVADGSASPSIMLQLQCTPGDVNIPISGITRPVYLGTSV